jgi:molecular chaperone GrpE
MAVWYDNNEEETPRKGRSAEDDSDGTQGDLRPADSVARSFPSHTDPTKAFDEDPEPLTGGPATADEITALKAAIKELDEKANANYDRYLRALAELENYKKRVARERMEQIRYAGEDLLRELLPVIDNLERTLSHSHEQCDVNKVLEGVSMIQRQFLKTLEKTGVTFIDKAPAPFDPAIHQALERVADKSHPDDTVLEILQKGYVLNGKVIRPAMVKVAKH